MEQRLEENEYSLFHVTGITSFRVCLQDASGNDNIRGVAAYLIDGKLVEK